MNPVTSLRSENLCSTGKGSHATVVTK